MGGPCQWQRPGLDEVLTVVSKIETTACEDAAALRHVSRSERRNLLTSRPHPGVTSNANDTVLLAGARGPQTISHCSHPHRDRSARSSQRSNIKPRSQWPCRIFIADKPNLSMCSAAYGRSPLSSFRHHSAVILSCSERSEKFRFIYPYHDMNNNAGRPSLSSHVQPL
jgi:hypothetical protein